MFIPTRATLVPRFFRYQGCARSSLALRFVVAALQAERGDGDLFEVAEGFEELVHLGNGFLVVDAAFLALVEESVALAIVNVEFAAGAGFFHGGLIAFQGGDGDELVIRAEEGDGGWGALADVVGGGEVFPVVFYFRVAPFARAVVEDWIEEDEGVGDGADLEILTVFFEAFAVCGGCGDVTSGGASTGGELVRIDSQLGGVFTDPADGGLTVFDAFLGSGLVLALDPVLGGDGDHAFRGEVFAVRVELGGTATDPAATKEEDDGGTFVGGFVALGIEDVELEGGGADFFVGDLGVRGRIGGER